MLRGRGPPPAASEEVYSRTAGAAGVGTGCVIQVADYGPLYRGNFLASLLRFRESLGRRRGLDTFLVFSELARGRPWIHELETQGVSFDFLDPRLGRARNALWLRREARRRGGVLIHSHFRSFDTAATAAAWSLGIPSVWHLHSHFPGYEAPAHLRERLFWRWGGHFVDGIVAVSDPVARTAVAKGAPASKVHVLPNGVDFSRLRRLIESERHGARARLGIPEGGRAFLLFGWAPEAKGVDVFGAAVRRLPAATNGRIVGLVVAGERNSSEVRSVLADAPGCRILEPVDDVSLYYGASDCFVSASRTEGLPYAIAEAMAVGLPVISSDLPSVAAALGETGDGLVMFPSGDAAALGRAMDSVAQLPSTELQRRGEGNRALALAKFSIDRWCDSMGALYDRILAR